jgi:hypothetical protein
MGASDSIVLGSLSTAMSIIPGVKGGIYIGNTLSSPAVDQGIASAMTGFVSALADAAMVGGKAISYMLGDKSSAVHRSDLHDVEGTLVPGVLQAPLDYALTPKTSNVVRGYERKPEDWNSLFWTGRKSVQEQRDRLTGEAVSGIMKGRQEDLKHSIDGLADAIQGKTIQGTQDEIIYHIVHDLHENASAAMVKAYEKAHNERLTGAALAAMDKSMSGMQERIERAALAPKSKGP